MLLDAIGGKNVVQISGCVVFLWGGVVGNPIAVDNELRLRLALGIQSEEEIEIEEVAAVLFKSISFRTPDGVGIRRLEPCPRQTIEGHVPNLTTQQAMFCISFETLLKNRIVTTQRQADTRHTQAD